MHAPASPAAFHAVGTRHRLLRAKNANGDRIRERNKAPTMNRRRRLSSSTPPNDAAGISRTSRNGMRPCPWLHVITARSNSASRASVKLFLPPVHLPRVACIDGARSVYGAAATTLCISHDYKVSGELAARLQ
ncbi:hypothetical protein PUN28_016696 [Cardiocondyla obscurior]|uniref:Uncharacterized protein n=1 Tax=Cardiocondyla obscurior TaxID=286306 RepID=A0AAW2ETP2_9HYME